MAPLRILHVLNSAHGGSAISTLELIAELETRGAESSLVCFNNASKKQEEELRMRLKGRVLFIPLYWMNKRVRSAWWKRPLIEASSLLRTWRGHRYQRQITALIRENKVNIIHTSTILNPEGAIAARRNKLPHLWHVRELIGPGNHFHFYWYAHWARYVSKRCKFLIANSSISEQCLLQYFNPAKIVCIPNGIRWPQFQVRNHSDNVSKKVVGMVGSVTTRWKNHEFFIRVAASLKAEAEFRIYGSLPNDVDPYYSFLKRLVQELGLNDTVKFIQFQAPAEIMEQIDVMFHPSEFESFGRIYVEAMAGGIPVVALNKGGALEMVRHGENGYLVGNGDIECATMNIRALLSSASLRNAFGRNGRDLVLQKYTIEALGKKMVDLYQKVLS